MDPEVERNPSPFCHRKLSVNINLSRYSSMKPGLSSPCRVFWSMVPTFYPKLARPIPCSSTAAGPLNLYEDDAYSPCQAWKPSSPTKLSPRYRSTQTRSVSIIRPSPLQESNRSPSRSVPVLSGGERSPHATWVAGWRPGEAPCQRVSSRNIAQQRISSRRATATMAIFLRDGLPR